MPVKKARFWKTQRYEKPGLNCFVTVLAWVSAIGLAVTAYWLWPFRKCKADLQEAAVIPLIIWGLFPPLFFWVEYHWFWLPYRKKLTTESERAAAFEEFKYSHETSRNIWLAVVGGLAVIYA